MKKIIALLGCSLFAFAGTASAAGCHYGGDSMQAASPLVESETPTDPKLLALLKEQKAAVKDVPAPVHN
ncbi:MAG: hypothetical protein V3U65_17325 [Granulosicoccaceae bacterium]